MKKLSFLILLICAPLVAQEKTKLAVMDLKARQGINSMVAQSLTDLVCTEIDKFGTFQVIGRDDMQAMLEHIADRQLLECDDTKCLAQVGGALGVEQLLSGNLGMIGTTYLVNLKLIDIDNASVINRVSNEYVGDESGLIQHVRNSVYVLFDKKDMVKDVAAAPAPKKPVAPQMMMEDPGPSKKTGKGMKILRYSLLGAGLTSAIVSFSMHLKSGKIYSDQYQHDPSNPETEDPMQVESARNEIEGLDGGRMIFGILSGVCLIGGGITFAF